MLVTALVWACVGGTVRAEPLVRVRAESRIELGVTHTDAGIAMSGALRDELGQPLPGRTLALEATPVGGDGKPVRQTLRTDAFGRFELLLADAERDYTLLATFAGDATHRGVRVERALERDRADVRLELRVPEGGVLDLDTEQIEVSVVAESDAGGEGLRMRLSDERGETLATGTTNARGRLTFSLDPGALGPAGPGLLRIESAGDERRAEAQTESRVVRRRRLELSLSPADGSFERGEAVTVRGRVRTRVGPEPDQAVGLYAGGQHLATVESDEQGHFQAELWHRAAPGPLTVEARVAGDAVGAHPPARAQVTVQITPASPLPWSWVLAALAATGAWLAWLSRRQMPAALMGEPEAGLDSRGSHVDRAQRRTRRADVFRVTGHAQDLRDGGAVSGAHVTLMHTDTESSCTLVTDADGRFASAVLRAGSARLRVEAPGYVATEADLQIPHRGEWSDFFVRLESLRARALSPFRRLALRLLPSARLWNVWTDRELLNWARQRPEGATEALADLTLRVERACYGDAPPDEAEVARIEREARDLEAGLPPRQQASAE